jgi:aminoglycoside phosphotransferase (APT) family kinase protein
MFTREVRFYREIAPYVGVRVPGCFVAEELGGATHLELEDLSDWRPGADPEAAGRTLAALHGRWAGRALERWPWLPRPDVSDLVDELFGEVWTSVRERAEVSVVVRGLGDSLRGRVADAEQRAAASGPVSLTHGDASARNMRTSPDGEVALLDWEDYGTGPGITDVAWHLVSSVAPADWDAVLAAYGESSGLDMSLPAAVVQALLTLSDEEPGSPPARAWVERIEQAARRL